jgi:hypothetical protein
MANRDTPYLTRIREIRELGRDQVLHEAGEKEKASGPKKKQRDGASFFFIQKLFSNPI